RRVRLRRHPRVGSGVDDEPVVPDRDEVAAEMRAGLDDAHLAALFGFLEGVRDREPRDATPDDDDALHPPRFTCRGVALPGGTDGSSSPDRERPRRSPATEASASISPLDAF